MAESGFDTTPVGQIIIGGMAVIFSAAVIGLWQYFKKKFGCIDVANTEIKEVRDDQYRIKRSIILLAKLLDSKTNHLHPESTPTNFCAEIEAVLIDEKDKL